MRKLIYGIKHKTRIIKWFISVLFLLVAIYIVQYSIINVSNIQRVNINNDWNIFLYREDYIINDVSSFKIKDIKRGEKIIMSRTLPDIDEANDALLCNTHYYSLRIYIENKLIYELGTDDYKKGNIVGSGYAIINIPKDSSGKKIIMEYTASENNQPLISGDILIMNSLDMIPWIISDKFILIVISLFGCTIGFVTLIGVFMFNIGLKNKIQLVYLGVFCIVSSVWLMCNSKIINIIFRDIKYISTIEYIMMYMSFAIFLFGVATTLNNKQKRITYSCCVILIMTELALIILNQYNIIHFCRSEIVFQGISIGIMVIMIIIIALDWKNATRSKKIFFRGTICILIIVITQIISYLYNMKISTDYHVAKTIVAPIAFSIVSLTVFSSLIMEMLDNIWSEKEKKRLIEIAYTDPLTQIGNRAWCEKVMSEYAHKNTSVTLINIDLNYFKNVNDTYGHAQGDYLLKVFASVLIKVFSKEEIGRMGGDEFIVIQNIKDDKIIENQIKILNDEIQIENGKLPYKILFAYGYASGKVYNERDIWDLYILADQKMFKDKRRR